MGNLIRLEPRCLGNEPPMARMVGAPLAQQVGIPHRHPCSILGEMVAICCYEAGNPAPYYQKFGW